MTESVIVARPPADRPLAGWAEQVAESLIAERLPMRWKHDREVIKRAHEVLAAVDEDDYDVLLTVAALHDVGFAPEAGDSDFPPLAGARFLRALGTPLRICRLVANSVSCRIEGELRGYVSDYEEWPDEVTPVRDAFWYCCATSSADGRKIELQERLERWPTQYADEPVVAEFARLARRPLMEAVARTEARLQP